MLILLSLALSHKQHSCIFFLLLPEYWCASFIFPEGPGPPPVTAVSVFSPSPLGRANTLSFLIPLSYLNPPVSLRALPFSPPLLPLAFPLPFASVLCPPNFSMGSISGGGGGH